MTTGPTKFKEPNWVGASNKKVKHDSWMNTYSKNIPSNMFKDADKDGVANVFDCQPHNPKEEGLIAALVGAAKGVVKGRAKEGWKEGMAKPSVRQKVVAQKQRFDKYQNQRAQRVRVERAKAQSDRQEEHRLAVERRTAVPGYQTANRVMSAIQSKDPNYKRKSKQGHYASRMNDQNLTKTQRDRARYLYTEAGAKGARDRGIAGSRLLSELAPVVGASYGTAKTIQGVSRGSRGRPKGSLDRRYAQFGGVYGYRKYLSQQKKLLRVKLQQQEQQMKQARQPQYEQKQYSEQLPQELQGQNIQPDYSQAPQAQQEAVQQYSQVPQQQVQYQQPQQTGQQQYAPQTQQEAPQREIKTVFKSHGGSPYTIPQRGLAPTSQTIPYGYIEVADAFTGRRYLKPLPKKEGWVQ